MTDIHNCMPGEDNSEIAELIESLLESRRGIQGYMKGNVGKEEIKA